MSDWNYGECSNTCGGGNRTNTRFVTEEERFGGKCIDKLMLVEECNTEECPGIIHLKSNNLHEIRRNILKKVVVYIYIVICYMFYIYS